MVVIKPWTTHSIYENLQPSKLSLRTMAFLIFENFDDIFLSAPRSHKYSACIFDLEMPQIT